jgi:anti-anti-sigma regulatory factor
VLRITCLSSTDAESLIKIEGRLGGEWVGELSCVTTQALTRAPRLRIDMSDVTFVDHSGTELLRSLRRRGVELAACSRFVAALLNGGRP